MKKLARFVIVWLLLTVFLNLLSFLTPEIIEGTKFVRETVVQTAADGTSINVMREHYSGGFWLGYIFANVSLVLAFIAGLLAFRSDDVKKQFLGLPIMISTYGSLTLLFIISIFTTILPVLPTWLNALLMMAIAIFALLAGTGAELVGDVVQQQDREIVQKTMLIKSLIAQIGAFENTVSAANREIWQKVYEALRYADPMSNDGLAAIEAQINEKAANFCALLNSDNSAELNTVGNALLALIAQRNTQSKLLK